MVPLIGWLFGQWHFKNLLLIRVLVANFQILGKKNILLGMKPLLGFVSGGLLIYVLKGFAPAPPFWLLLIALPCFRRFVSQEVMALTLDERWSFPKGTKML